MPCESWRRKAQQQCRKLCCDELALWVWFFFPPRKRTQVQSETGSPRRLRPQLSPEFPSLSETGKLKSDHKTVAFRLATELPVPFEVAKRGLPVMQYRKLGFCKSFAFWGSVCVQGNPARWECFGVLAKPGEKGCEFGNPGKKDCGNATCVSPFG